MTTASVTFNGVTLFKYEQLTPTIGLYLDNAGGWRLHTGEAKAGFRGYAQREFDTWTVRAFCPATGFRFKRRHYKTETGAVQALSRQAALIKG